MIADSSRQVPCGTRRRRATTLAFAIAAVVGAPALLAACGSGSAAETGETVIETKLADDIGLGDLDATCDEPDDLKEGETFTCTATTDDGTTIEFLGTTTADDKLNIVTTNLLSADDIDQIRETVAASVTDAVGEPVTADDITCQDGSVVLDDRGDFDCTIYAASSGDTFAITISTGGIEPGKGVRKLDWKIGDAPL